MISDKQITHISKFLSLVLRHQPETIGIQLDQSGWTDIAELIEKANNYGIKFDREILNHIVATNSKKRFAFNDTLDKIRASQGHSIEIELGYTNQKPPEILFHGTGEKYVQSILDTGLEKRSRQHVHQQRTRTTFEGRSQGISVKIAKGVYYRTGQFKGNPVVSTQMTFIATGLLALTNKNLYFASNSKSFKTPYKKLISMTQYSDGIGLQKDGVTAKPQIFKDLDGWFAYNVISNLRND